jgi:hypothetical protein
MLRKMVFLAAAAILAALLTSSKAQSWGAYHVGFTHYGAGGFYHYGHTSASGPYGGFSAGRYGAYGAGGSYHGAYASRYGSADAYHTYTPHYDYHYGGMSTGDFHGGYRSGYYRRW